MRSETRVIGTEFCTIRVQLSEQGELSITGETGDIMSRKKVRDQALALWESFFEESPQELRTMGARFNKRFRNARAGALFVTRTDGEFHGLDVHLETETKVYVTHSCGQIIAELTRFFPEYVPYFRWHLNHMHSDCVHQEARGETYQTHPSAKCPECGNKLGQAWLRRELPPEVIAWAQNVGQAA